MSSLITELHEARKERLSRIATAAQVLEDRKRAERDQEQAAALEKYFEMKKPKPEPIDPVVEWVDRQKQKHKEPWFSIVSAVKACKSGAPTIRTIQRATCDVYGIDISDLLSASCTWDIARPRMISMYLARELTDLSLSRISGASGGRDHTCVINAVKRIGLLIKSDEKLAGMVALIRERLA